MLLGKHVFYISALLVGLFITGRSIDEGLARLSIVKSVRVVQNDDKAIMSWLRDKKVMLFYRWQVGDDERNQAFCIVRACDENPNYECAGVKLSIVDGMGRVIHEEHYSEVYRMYPVFALRKAHPQLVIEGDYGGSAKFFEMLDYRNGQIVSLMGKPNNDFSAGAEVRPQFRTEVNAAKEPFQILLTHGASGLASPGEKYTNVYRYKEGSYRFVGSFPQQRVDDYMEKLMRGNLP